MGISASKLSLALGAVWFRSGWGPEAVVATLWRKLLQLSSLGIVPHAHVVTADRPAQGLGKPLTSSLLRPHLSACSPCHLSFIQLTHFFLLLEKCLDIMYPLLPSMAEDRG